MKFNLYKKVFLISDDLPKNKYSLHGNLYGNYNSRGYNNISGYNSPSNFPRKENPWFKNMYKLAPSETQFITSFLINGVFIYFKTDRYTRGYLPGEYWEHIRSLEDFDHWVELNWKLILFTWITIHIILTILGVMWTTHWPTPTPYNYSTPYNYATTSNLYKYFPSTIQIFLSTLIAAIGTFYIRHYDIWISRSNDLWSGSVMNILDKPDTSDFLAIYELLIKEWPFSLLLIFLIWSFFTIFYRIWTIHW